MTEQKVKRPFAARYLQGCATSVLLRILVVPVVLCCVLAWLAATVRVIDQTYGTEMEVLGVVGAGLSGICVFVLLPLALAAGIIWQQGRRLDALFAPLGLSGSRYAVRWRQYQGMVGGREMTAKVSRGLTVNLAILAPLGTQMGIGTRTGLGSALSGFSREHLLELDDPALAHLAASAHDKEWARGLLASEARSAILRLLKDEGPYEVRNLVVAPGALSFIVSQVRLKNLSAERVGAWVEDMQAVVDAASDLPEPAA